MKTIAVRYRQGWRGKLDKVTNEMLMAFVDDELDPATRKKIKTALQSDPELRAKAAIFEATGRSIAGVFDPILSRPLSQLREPIPTGAGKAGLATSAPPESNRHPAGFFKWLSGLFEVPTALSLALVLCVVFLGGLGLGFLMKTDLVPSGAPDADLVAFRDDGLLAAGHLNHTLETIGSGSRFAKAVSGGKELVIKPILTFRDIKNRTCREYEVLYPSTSRFAGLACRTRNGDWNVIVHTQIASRPANGNDTAVASAGGLETIDAVVERIIKGDALGADQEALLMNKGWRDQE